MASGAFAEGHKTFDVFADGFGVGFFVAEFEDFDDTLKSGFVAKLVVVR